MSATSSPEPPAPAAWDDAAGRTTGGSVIRSGLWNATSRFIPQSYTLVLSVAAARFLGPDGLGRQSFIAFVVLSVTQLLSGGLSVAVQRFVGDTLGAGEPGKVRGLARWSWRLQLSLGVLGAAGLASAGLAGSTPRDAWLLAALACLFAVAQSVPNAVLTGAQRWREASIIGLVTGGLTVPVVILVLALGGGITGMFAVEAAVALTNLTWSWLVAKRLLRELAPGAVPPGELTRRAGLFALQTTLGTVISLIVFTRSEFFFLASSSDDAEIALYSISFAAQAALVLVPTAAAGVMLPAFATLIGAGDTERLAGGYARALRLITLIAVPLAAVAFALIPATIRVVYGTEYAGTAPVVRIMLLVVPLVPLSTAASGLLLAAGHVRRTLVIGAVAAGVNIGLDLLLIPRYDAVGAALANVGGQLTAAVATLWFARQVIGRAEWGGGALGRIVAFATLAGLAGAGADALVDGAPGLLAGGIATALALLLLARVLRPVPAEDAAWLRRETDNRLGRLVDRALAIAAPPVSPRPGRD